MYADSHVHIQPHGERPQISRARVDAYVESARANGVELLAFTEHLFRFTEARDTMLGWWDEGADPTLAAHVERYVDDEISGSVADYVRVIEEAKADGLPVLLGLEMDWVPGREEELRRFLAPYDWDIILGSVHWIGPWGFDSSSEADQAEWARRDIDDVHAGYAELLRDLAASGLADVLAHPDLPKLFGHRPSSWTPLHDAIIEAARGGNCAVEINTNGWNKPVAEAYPAPPVLERASALGLPVTLASDAHRPEHVGRDFDRAVALARDAGYESYLSFQSRRRQARSLVPAEAGR